MLVARRALWEWLVERLSLSSGAQSRNSSARPGRHRIKPEIYNLEQMESSERLLFSPKQTLRNTHLDSVSMSAFGHKQSFA